MDGGRHNTVNKSALCIIRQLEAEPAYYNTFQLDTRHAEDKPTAGAWYDIA